MTSILKVWIIDPQNPKAAPVYDPTPRLINISDFETMKKSARDALLRADYKIRSLSHTQSGELVAYVYHKDAKPLHVVPVAGWVFKRSKAPPEI